MIRPGPAAILGLGICMIPALGLAVRPGMAPWLGASLLIWLAVTLISAARLPRAEHLLLETTPQGTARMGHTSKSKLRLTNLHFQHLRADLALVHDAPMHVRQGRMTLALAPGEQADWVLEITPLQRGALDCGVMLASVRGGIGWLERVVELPLNTEIPVHPDALSPRLLAALYPDALPDRLQPTTERVLFSGLRPFVPGDDARDLSWSASARTRSPMVRTWEGPREGPVLLLLDRGAGMAVAMDRDSSRLDRAVAVATGLLRSLEHAGRPVTVATWSAGLDAWIPRASRSAARALAALQPADQPWDPTLLGETLRRRLAPASTVIILTEPDGEPQALARSLSLLRPHAAVRVLLVGEPALTQAARAPVFDLDQAYDCAAALALSDQRRGAIAAWRAGGATVVDAGGRRRRISVPAGASSPGTGTLPGPQPAPAPGQS